MVVNISRNVKFGVIFLYRNFQLHIRVGHAVCVCVCLCVSADWYEESDKENNTLNCNHQHVVCLYFLYMFCT